MTDTTNTQAAAATHATAYQVTSVPAATVAAGMLQVTARVRNTKDKSTGKTVEIEAKDRSRSITIPEFQPAVSSKYVGIIVACLAQAAQDQLKEQWTQMPELQEVDAALYTEAGVLAFANRAAESKKLNSASILDWFLQSALRKELLTKLNAKQLTRFTEELQNIAAPTPDYSEEKALKRIATLGMFPDDLEHEVCLQLVTKLNNRIEKIKADREAIGSMEELPV